ncbi:Heat shock protein DnaJ domain-containing protein [uncultured Pleomorphomonas sp.]|uniref:Heat shock protein DnaJ domain-containing protein n=1 Tax=uncultured Pleomorphomonas sp. TaxID=442121 RepID=A0A212LQL7_9HYPH|nr:J domain-containing protein [uncultured Pleomorphomonas sp.]SCM79806.1 Heat shock protein DnaJ domain-containing protein [uncultured Pleomorphomonas sp.]
MTTAYPLSWPEGFPRSQRRETGNFRTTLAVALKNVQDSLRLFGRDSGKSVQDVILSSNVTLGVGSPSDPGVAAWFMWDGEQRCIPVDRYSTPAANLQAIHHVLEARRVELRHGTLALVRATFRGFTAALPAPGRKPWHQVLGVRPSATKVEVDGAYKRLARERHPDVAGGSDALMAELNAARDLAYKENGFA